MESMSINHPSLFPQMPEPSKIEVLGLLEPYYPDLWWTVMEPWRDVQERRLVDAAFRRRKGRDLAWWLYPEMVHLAETIFESHDLRPILLENGMFALRYQDKLLITFKRLKRRRFKKKLRRLERSNYLTPTNRNYHDQRSDRMFPDIPRVIVGYETIKEETEIRVLVAYPPTQERGFEWDQEISASPAASTASLPPPAGPQGDSPTRGFTITPKKDAKESGEK